MTEVAFLHLCDAQSRLIAELLAPAEREDGAAVERVEPLVPTFIAVCRSGRDALEALHATLFFQVKRLLPIATAAREALPRMLTTVELIRRAGRRLAAAGSDADQLAELEAAVDEFREAIEEFLLRWPRVDPDRIAESAADYERGELHDAREALNELLRQADGGR